MDNQMVLFGKDEKYEIAFDIAKNNLRSQKIGDMLNFAEQYRLCGNVFKSFVAWLIIHDENPYSLSCEMNDAENGGLKRFALNDVKTLMDLFNADLRMCESYFADFSYTNLLGNENAIEIGTLANRLAEKLKNAEDEDEFLSIITDFYRECGVGELGLNKAFYLDLNNGMKLVPVSDFDRCRLDDMWGYEYQKQQLRENTVAFINKHAANNVLLYGDSGTGKSTSIKAILNEYSPLGLRMVEVYKHQFSCLPRLIELLRLRNYRFIIYMDDLSFEDFEIEYKFLKAVIEGGLEKKPDNVLIYATSNRRHLIKESFSDRDSAGDDIHKNDTVQEKLSLSDRFGLTIGFSKPLQKEYFEIVKHLAHKNHIAMSDDELCAKASQWGLKHGGISGRVARQFINHLSHKTDDCNE